MRSIVKMIVNCRARRRCGALLAGLATLMLVAAPAAAQFGAQCQTNFGVCPASPGPVGAPCFCVGPGFQAPGRIMGSYGWGGGPMVSPFCRTFRGVCQIGGVAPVGTPCNCFGELGQIVPP